jgi:uncharacterized protein YkwD
MDFGQLHKGASALLAGVFASINLAAVPAPSPSPLQTPVIAESFNLPDKVLESEITNEPFNALDVITSQNDLGLKLVVREAQASEVVTVEQPPVVYTVTQPTPKPSATAETKDSKNLSPEEKILEETKTASKAAQDKTESPSPSPTALPSTTPVASGNSNSEAMFQMVNDYRAKLGLKAFEKDERICKIAEGRAPQVNGELESGNLHKGFRDLNLPYWASENIAAYSTIEQDFKFWISDYIHKKAIESDNKYSCVACSGASCSQIFTSFVSK